MSKTKNTYPKVVTRPGGRVGGTNTAPKVVTNPTRYKGGMNKGACDVPKKQVDVKSSNISKSKTKAQ